MALFGLATKKEQAAILQEMEALKASTMRYEKWMLEAAAAEKFNIPDPSVYANQADLYRTLSWVLTAVDMTAQAGALTDFSVGRIIAGKEPKDIPNHEFELLLRNPNELDSRFEFLYATIAYWKLTGNSYWWLNRKDEYTAPNEMWVIPPQMITPIPDEKMFLRGYLYDSGTGKEIFLEPHEIVHFKRFNPFSRFVGLSAIESIALVARGDLGMQDWNTKLFAENNARLPGILTFQEMVQNDTWQKIKEDTREASTNRSLLMLRGVGAGGVNWLQNSVSQRDMEFLAGRKANKEEIYSVLAPGLMSMLSENSTEANSVAGRATFTELTVYPMHVMMAEKITSQVLTSYGGRQLVGYFEDIRVTDRQLELQEQDKYSETHTLEEIRLEYYGDEPLGDERDKLLPSQVTAKASEPALPQLTKPEIQQPTQAIEMKTDIQVDESAKYSDELKRWERKAVKAFGTPRALEFESNLIPVKVHSAIKTAIKAAKSVDAVKQAFVLDVEEMSDVQRLARAIEKAVAGG